MGHRVKDESGKWHNAKDATVKKKVLKDKVPVKEKKPGGKK